MFAHHPNHVKIFNLYSDKMQWYNYSYYTVLVLGIAISLIKWNQLLFSLKILSFTLICVLISEGLGRIFRELYGNNIFIYSLARPITFALIGVAFYTELQIKWILASIIGYIVFHIVNLIFFQPYAKIYDSYSMNASLIINTIWCLNYLYYIFQQPPIKPLFKFSLFWPTCGYLLFNASTMIVFATLNYTNTPAFKNAFIVMQTIRVTASHLLYLTFLAAFLSSDLRKNSF